MHVLIPSILAAWSLHPSSSWNDQPGCETSPTCTRRELTSSVPPTGSSPTHWPEVSAGLAGGAAAGSPRQDDPQKFLNIRSRGWLSTAHRLHEKATGLPRHPVGPRLTLLVEQILSPGHRQDRRDGRHADLWQQRPQLHRCPHAANTPLRGSGPAGRTAPVGSSGYTRRRRRRHRMI
jgi:hypothetical protein